MFFYKSPSENNIQDLLRYLTRTVDQMINSEYHAVKIVGDFNVYNESQHVGLIIIILISSG